MTLAESLVERARRAGVLIVTAESCTGGLLAGAITDVAGSSDVFDRGFVTYSNAAKMQMLAVSRTALETYGAVSEPVAAEMAVGALSASGAGIALSITGIAGPGGSDHKPEGRVCFGLARPDNPPHVETVEFGPLGRAGVRRASVNHALTLLVDALS